MPRPTEVRKETSVGRGRGRTKRKQTRPTRKKKEIARFDFNEFKRMEYWNGSKTKEENKRRNPVKRKKIGGQRKALKLYLKVLDPNGEKRQQAKDLFARIQRAEEAKKGCNRKGGSTRCQIAWSVWGLRTTNERKSNNKVMRRVIKWAAEEVRKSKGAILPRQAENQLPNPNSDVKLTSAEQQRVDEHKWIKIKKTQKTNRNNLVSEKLAPVQCSNDFEALKDATIYSDTQDESDSELKKQLPLSQEDNQWQHPNRDNIRKRVDVRGVCKRK